MQQTIKKSFSVTSVPVSILPEPPEGGSRVIIEVGFADVEKVRVSYGQAETLNFCRLSAVNYAEYWFAGVERDTNIHSISGSADCAFNKLYKAFLQLGIGFNNIVRQWNYIEQIVFRNSFYCRAGNNWPGRCGKANPGNNRQY